MRPCPQQSGRRLTGVNDAARRLCRSPVAIIDPGSTGGLRDLQAGTKKRSLRPNQETPDSGWAPEDQPVHPQGANASDGKMVRTWVGTLRAVIAHHSASRCLEPDPRYPSWPAVAIRPHPEAEYMTAPDQYAEPAKLLLANRGPSIHDGIPSDVSSSAGRP